MSAIIDAILGRLPDVEPIAFSSGVHTPNSDRTLQTTTHTLGVDGTLTGLEVVTVAGSPNRDLYVKATLEDDQQIERSTLFRGYIDGSSTPNGNGAIPVKGTWKLKLESWGYVSNVNLVLRGTMLSKKRQAGGGTGTDEPSTGPVGTGKIRFITGTNPAAGSEILETIATGSRTRVITFFAVLVTDATVTNRRAVMVIDNPATTAILRIRTAADIPASQTQEFNFYNGANKETTVITSTLDTYLPAELWLEAGGRIHLTAVGLQAGDDFAAPLLTVEDQISIA